MARFAKSARADIFAAGRCSIMAATSLLAQTNLTGVWILRVPRTDGTFNESFFELKQDREAIAGTMLGNRETPTLRSLRTASCTSSRCVGVAGAVKGETMG